MQELNIIGDIAGQYKTLLSLLEKMPKSAKLFSVGDMIDRGPQSKEVLEYIMQNGTAILGNHEHMMLSSVDFTNQHKVYGLNTWLSNGGLATLKSFYPNLESGYIQAANAAETFHNNFPEIFSWLKQLPMFHKQKKLFISHAPYPAYYSIKQATTLSYNNINQTIIWNRDLPIRMKGKVQIFGHNSHWGLRNISDDKGSYALCIDTSKQNILTGIHWPSMEIFQQTYVD